MKQRSLGGSASNIKVGEIGYGLMGTLTVEYGIDIGFTWGRTIPDDQAFEAMKAAIEAGATFWNAGVFYGRGPNGESPNIELVARFFEKYPEFADKVFLSVKGSITIDHQIDGSAGFLRKDIDGILKNLRGKKKLDLFECARVDPKT
jgi:pyridoxine 4-dehydrogenase